MKQVPMQEADYKALSHCLPRVDLFSALPMSGLERLMRSIELYEAQPGQYIFRQGELGDAFYIVIEGELDVIRRPFFFFPGRKTASLGPGQFFGEMALLDRRPHSASVRAKTPVRLFALMLSAFDLLCSENPGFSTEIKNIAERRRYHNLHSH